MKNIKKIVELVMSCASIAKEEKTNIVNDLEYLPEWQLDKLYNELVDLKQEEEKYKSDAQRIDLKYKQIVEKEIEKSGV